MLEEILSVMLSYIQKVNLDWWSGENCANLDSSVLD